MDETSRTCPWCSGRIPAGAGKCPECGAAVEGAFPSDMPGLTTIDPRAPRGRLPDQMPDPIGWLRAGREKVGNRDAYAVPSDEVLREIHRMELEADVLDPDDWYPGPIDGELVDVDAPLDSDLAASGGGAPIASDATRQDVTQPADPAPEPGPGEPAQP